MNSCPADAYLLGPSVMACVYRPPPDQHLPLVGDAIDGWRLISWAIVPGDLDLPIYVVVFKAMAPVWGAVPAEMPLDTSFGPRRLILTFSPEWLPSPLAMLVAEAILAVAGRQRAADMPDLLAALSRLPKPAPDLRHIAKLTPTDTGVQLHVSGCHVGFYVAAQTRAGPAFARVTAIRYEGAADIRTTLDLDAPVIGDAVWLLGDGRYLLITVAA